MNFILIDREPTGAELQGPSGRDNQRIMSAVGYNDDFHSAYEKQKNRWKNVVRFIDSKSGETIKGPKYDTTTFHEDPHGIEYYAPRGLKVKPPIEPTQHEPRDRFQENRNMITKEKFSKLVQECMAELKEASKSPREKLKESLRPMVQQVLGEIANVKTKQVDDDKDEVEKVKKGFTKMPIYQKDPEIRLDKSNEEKIAELEKIVKDINPDWETYWDDYGQMIVRAQNLLYVRIVPKFEDNFDIDAYVKLVDRIRAIALTWEQVKAFVKENFKDVGKNPEGNKTKADKAYEKSLANKVDQDKNKKAAGPDHDLIKNRLEDPEHTKLKDTKKKDMDYKEDQVKKDEDQPDQPMKDVGEPKNLNKNIEKTTKVKPPKHEDDKTLRAKDKKTSKFRLRK